TRRCAQPSRRFAMARATKLPSFARRKNSWRKRTMIDDPIVAEVRRVREAYAAQFNYDLEAIYRDLKQREKASGRRYVRYPPRTYNPQEHQAPERAGAGG